MPSSLVCMLPLLAGGRGFCISAPSRRVNPGTA